MEMYSPRSATTTESARGLSKRDSKLQLQCDVLCKRAISRATRDDEREERERAEREASDEKNIRRRPRFLDSTRVSYYHAFTIKYRSDAFLTYN
jgi:hypothetical protein